MSENNGTEIGTEQDEQDEPEPVASAMALTDENVKKVLSDPASFGFDWIGNEICKGKGSKKEVLRSDSPEPKVTDLGKFRAAFGDAIVLESINGTSVVVRAQGVTRKLFDKNVTASVESAREAIVRRVLLGERTKGPQTVRTVTVEVIKTVYPDGKEYESMLAYQQHMIAQYIEMGLSIEQGKKLLGIAV